MNGNRTIGATALKRLMTEYRGKTNDLFYF